MIYAVRRTCIETSTGDNASELLTGVLHYKLKAEKNYNLIIIIYHKVNNILIYCQFIPQNINYVSLSAGICFQCNRNGKCFIQP